jgi:hypothetical protein
MSKKNYKTATILLLEAGDLFDMLEVIHLQLAVGSQAHPEWVALYEKTVEVANHFHHEVLSEALKV